MLYIVYTSIYKRNPRNQVQGRKTGSPGTAPTSKLDIFLRPRFCDRFCEPLEPNSSDSGVVLEVKIDEKAVCVDRQDSTCFRCRILNAFRYVFDTKTTVL